MSNSSSTEETIDNQIELLLKDVAEEEGLYNYKIEKAPRSGIGNGYLGVVTSIVITGKTNSRSTKALHLIVKSANKSDSLRDDAPLVKVYEREVFVYNQVIPTFQRFEKERGLPQLSYFPKCYKACMLNKSESLILEDLREAGYTVWEKKLPMEHDHVNLVMKQFGRFHALSLALRDQESETFKKLADNISDIFTIYVEKTDFIKTFERQCRKALKALDSDADRKAYSRFEKFIDEMDGFLKNLPNLVDKYSVILHGDGWTNNMMFKYGDKTNLKKPTEVSFLDLQISRLGSPVLDLSYFFYACCSKTVLDNYKLYMRTYHASLSDYLGKLGSNPEKVYPYSVFEDQWQQISKFGLINAPTLLHVMLTEDYELTDLAEVTELGKGVTDALDYTLANEAIFNDRIRHVILHFINNGLI